MRGKIKTWRGVPLPELTREQLVQMRDEAEAQQNAISAQASWVARNYSWSEKICMAAASPKTWEMADKARLAAEIEIELRDMELH